MVAKTVIARHIDIELKSLRLMLGDLPEVAAEWPELGDGERASWSLDWDQLMGALQVILEPSYRAGAMTPDQQACYQELLHDLREALPFIAQIELLPPPVPLGNGVYQH